MMYLQPASLLSNNTIINYQKNESNSPKFQQNHSNLQYANQPKSKILNQRIDNNVIVETNNKQSSPLQYGSPQMNEVTQMNEANNKKDSFITWLKQTLAKAFVALAVIVVMPIIYIYKAIKDTLGGNPELLFGGVVLAGPILGIVLLCKELFEDIDNGASLREMFCSADTDLIRASSVNYRIEHAQTNGK